MLNNDDPEDCQYLMKPWLLPRGLSYLSQLFVQQDLEYLSYPESIYVSLIGQAGFTMLMLSVRLSRRYLREVAARWNSRLTRRCSSEANKEAEMDAGVKELVMQSFKNCTVIISSDPAVISEVVKTYFSGVKFLGLDCEWVSSYSNSKSEGPSPSHARIPPVSLLQLASKDVCLLAQLSKLTSIPSELNSLLTNRHVLKFGVGIDEDAKRLLAQFGLVLRGWVDLRYLVLRCCHAYGSDHTKQSMKGLSLSALSANLAGITLDKSFKIRCSDWSADRLSDAQIAYAATDAISALAVFHYVVLRKQAKKGKVKGDNGHVEHEDVTVDHLPKLLGVTKVCELHVHSRKVVEHEESLIKAVTREAEEFQNQGMSFCKGITELPYSNKFNAINKGEFGITGKRKTKGSGKDKIEQKASKVPIREHPLYENCYLQGPDGSVLCTCDSKKAYWYVQRTGARVVSEDPLTVRLTFEPSGRPLQENDYYTTVKENRCVVCGREDQYVRKMVIPHDYRRYFPSDFKDHLSHDVLLLCPPCHLISCSHDERLRQELAVKYNAPLGTHGNLQFKSSRERVKVRAYARALLHNGERIPEERKEVLERAVLDYAGVDQLSVALLENLAALDVRVNNEGYIGSHGEIVVQKLKEENGVRDFVRMWRQHFLETMDPKHLPPMWSVEHNLDINEK